MSELQPNIRPMKFEHFALNVPDTRAMSLWYVQHLGFKIVRSRDDAPYTHFLADETGRVFVELYTNPKATIPNYAAAHPLCFHFAVVATERVPKTGPGGMLVRSVG